MKDRRKETGIGLRTINANKDTGRESLKASGRDYLEFEQEHSHIFIWETIETCSVQLADTRTCYVDLYTPYLKNNVGGFNMEVFASTRRTDLSSLISKWSTSS